LCACGSPVKEDGDVLAAKVGAKTLGECMVSSAAGLHWHD
jgi:hypothetical protein